MSIIPINNSSSTGHISTASTINIFHIPPMTTKTTHMKNIVYTLDIKIRAHYSPINDKIKKD